RRGDDEDGNQAPQHKRSTIDHRITLPHPWKHAQCDMPPRLGRRQRRMYSSRSPRANGRCPLPPSRRPAGSRQLGGRIPEIRLQDLRIFDAGLTFFVARSERRVDLIGAQVLLVITAPLARIFLIATRRWNAEPSWIDRLGRILGALAIVCI